MKTVWCLLPPKRPVFAHAAFGNEAASDDPFVISKLHHVKLRFNRIPLRLKLWITHELRFDLVILVARADQRFVVAMLNLVLVFGNGALRSIARWQWKQIDEQNHLLV